MLRESRYRRMGKRGQFFPMRDVNPVSRFTFVNWILIAINVIVFFLSLSSFEQTIRTWGFTPAEFSIITMFTSMFLHGGLAHLFGNMWFLFIFGDNVEDRLGHLAYLIFYIAAGVAATLAHYILNIGSTIPAVGASGAISGVLGAYLILFPHADIHVMGGYGVGRVKAGMMLLFWFGFQLLSAGMGLLGTESSIAFFAHIGGFVFGALAGLVFKGLSKRS